MYCELIRQARLIGTDDRGCPRGHSRNVHWLALSIHGIDYVP